MKRIAFIVSSLDFGGAQRAVSNITLGLSDSYQIDIVLNNNDIKYPYKGNIISLGVKSRRDRDSVLYQLGAFLKRLKIRRIRKRNSYYAVISFLDSANIINILTRKMGGIVIVSVRDCLSYNDNWKYRYIVSPMVRKLYNKADYIVAVSKEIKQDLIKNYGLLPDKIRVIYNGCDLKTISSYSKAGCSVKKENGVIDFVTMGRITKQKGQWHLIRAFSRLYQENKSVRLYIMGEGEYREYLESLINAYDLSNCVFMRGFEDNPYSVLARMDVFVLPSLHEGFSNALLEAMACGLPCISTDHKSGAREILCNNYEADVVLNRPEYADYGVLIPNMSGICYDSTEELDSNECMLFEVLYQFASDIQLRKMYARKSKDRIKDFSIQEVCRRWEELL